MSATIPQFLAQGGGFDWETLVPILFFVLYGIAQLFGSRKETKEQRERAERAARGEPTDKERQLSEEARRIKEEIRRKIAERQAAARGERAEPAPPVEAKVPQQPAARSLQGSPSRTERPMDSMQREVREKREAAARQLQQTLPDASRSMEMELRRQRDRLDAARKEREAALSKARAVAREAGAYAVERAPTASSALTGDLIRQLKDPNGARKAILYSEIIGPPLASRREGQAMWQQ